MVWVAVAGPVVVRIDPASNAIVETVQVGVLPVALGAGALVVLVAGLVRQRSARSGGSR